MTRSVMFINSIQNLQHIIVRLILADVPYCKTTVVGKPRYLVIDIYDFVKNWLFETRNYLKEAFIWLKIGLKLLAINYDFSSHFSTLSCM